MGFFRKKNNDSLAEDFILDFSLESTSFPENSEQETQREDKTLPEQKNEPTATVTPTEPTTAKQEKSAAVEKSEDKKSQPVKLDAEKAPEKSKKSKKDKKKRKKQNTEDEMPIKTWDERKKVTAPHAMTVDEILGNPEHHPATAAMGNDSASGESIKPKQQINATDLDVTEGTFQKPSAPAVEIRSAEISLPDDKEIIDLKAGTMPSPAVDETPADTALFEREEKPLDIPTADNTDEPSTEAQTQDACSKAETSPAEPTEASELDTAAAELIKSLKAQSYSKLWNSMPEIEAQLKDPAEKAAKESREPAIENEPTETANAEPPATEKEEKPAPVGALSPAAQALYDRMMAQRARRQVAEQTAVTAESVADTEPEAAETFTADNKTEALQESKPQSETESTEVDIALEPETAEIAEKPEENLSDSIFAELSRSLKNESPLLKKRQPAGESLVSICKNYVADAPTSSDSIENIIHNAEMGARERLSSLYNIQNDEIRSKTGSSVFSKGSDAWCEANGNAEINLDKSTSSNEAVGETRVDIALPNDKEFASRGNGDATRIIDPKGYESHPKYHADTAKIETIRHHLDAMAQADLDFPEETVEKMKLSGSDEVELPDGDVSSSEHIDDIDDYTGHSDDNRVRTDLASKKVSVAAKLISTAVLTLTLSLVDFCFKSQLLAASPIAFSAINLVLLGLAMIINFSIIKGLASLSMGCPDIDSPCALAAVAGFTSVGITAVFGLEDKLPALAPIAALALLFNLVGKYLILSRVGRDFKTVSDKEDKLGISFVEDKTRATVMAGGSVIGEALICGGRKCTNITGFLKNSYSEDPYEKRLKPMMIVTLCVSLVMGVLGFVFGGGIAAGIAALALGMMVFCPPSSLLCCAMPMNSASKSLSSYDAMLAGYSAVESLSNANAVAFSASELFPTGTVKLYNMQVLNRGAVDKYLTSAAAVLSAAGSPLCPIFEEMVADSGEKLPTADSVKYENGMGVSGWTGEHRVFIGNRTLMEGHNIRVPSLELDKKILRSGYFPVYLAFDQQLCALFIVGYEADETVTYELRRLCSAGVTMLVDTNDPNITEEMLCDYFGLYRDSIKIMSPSAVSGFKSSFTPRESLSASACFKGSVCGFLAAVTSAIRLKSIIDILLIIQLCGIGLTTALCGYLLVTGALLTMSSLYFGVAQLVLTAIIAIISSFYQP